MWPISIYTLLLWDLCMKGSSFHSPKVNKNPSGKKIIIFSSLDSTMQSASWEIKSFYSPSTIKQDRARSVQLCGMISTQTLLSKLGWSHTSIFPFTETNYFSNPKVPQIPPQSNCSRDRRFLKRSNEWHGPGLSECEAALCAITNWHSLWRCTRCDLWVGRGGRRVRRYSCSLFLLSLHWRASLQRSQMYLLPARQNGVTAVHWCPQRRVNRCEDDFLANIFYFHFVERNFIVHILLFDELFLLHSFQSFFALFLSTVLLEICGFGSCISTACNLRHFLKEHIMYIRDGSSFKKTEYSQRCV